MEERPKEKGRRGEGSSSEGRSRETRSISTIEAIHEIAKKNASSSLDTQEQLELYLKSWWSKTYNRPLKDPLLQEYTFEELLYEFYDRVERNRAEKEQSAKANDRIEEDRLKENLDWAEEEERKELEALRKKQQEQAKEKPKDPTEDPENVKWMEEQVQKEIEQGKKLFGDDFGEDIDFEDR
jgi:hypothetical protein